MVSNSTSGSASKSVQMSSFMLRQPVIDVNVTGPSVVVHVEDQVGVVHVVPLVHLLVDAEQAAAVVDEAERGE